MRYEYSTNPDSNIFATNLRWDAKTNFLYWDSSSVQEMLLIQTPYGVDPQEMMEELCQDMERLELPRGQYTEIRSGIWARFVNIIEKAQMNGCPINTEASTYTVFACQFLGDTCSILKPQNQAMIKPYCHVPMDIHVDIEEDLYLVRRFLRKEWVPSGFYRLTFPQGFTDAYIDGGLMYQVADMKIPITRAMLEQGVVFVRTSRKPVILSNFEGLNVV